MRNYEEEISALQHVLAMLIVHIGGNVKIHKDDFVPMDSRYGIDIQYANDYYTFTVIEPEPKEDTNDSE